MLSSTFVAALLAVGALASPVLDTRNLPNGVAPHQHNHLEYHLLKTRQKVAARGLAASHAPADNDDDTPAEDFIEMMDKEFGESLGQGPSDDWHPDETSSDHADTPQRPAESAPESAPVAVKENVIHVVVTKTIHAPSTASNVHDSAQVEREKDQQMKAKAEQAAREKEEQKKAKAEQAAREKAQQEKAKQDQTKNQKVPQQQTQPQPAKNQEKSRPVTQEQPKNEQPKKEEPKKEEPKKEEPKEEEPKKEQPKTQEKPQPTEHKPASKPASGGEVSTDGLPKEFVPDLGCDTEIFKGLSKQHHNIHRTNHSLDGLAWNDTLYEYAKETAETCVYGHDLTPGGGGYGQNIAAGNAPGNISAVLTNGFYNGELELFLQALGGTWGGDSPEMSNFEKWGHLTQMLWKTTTSFACYTASCSPKPDPLDCNDSGQSYLKNVGCGNGGTRAYNTVCNYYPPGNYAGEYSSVPPPEGIMALVQMTLDGLVGLD